jgi:hypothetical protein
VSLLPDPEVLLIAALRAQPPVTALFGQRISTRLQADELALRITLLGGRPRPTNGTSSPEFQVESWGPGTDSKAEAAAFNGANAVESVVDELSGTYTSGRVISAYMIGYLLHSPDAGTGRQRYLFQIGALMQANDAFIV